MAKVAAMQKLDAARIDAVIALPFTLPS